jgi:hypothetical protein
MRRSFPAIGLFGLFLSAHPAFVAGAAALPNRTIYVDCEAIAGDGSKAAPFPGITTALPAARAAALAYSVTIDVAEGVCDKEVFPIELNFPVWVRGSRSPGHDADGWPVDDQAHDSLVTWHPPAPPGSRAVTFFRITAGGVRISKLSLDGQILPSSSIASPPVPAPTGVLAVGATGFELRELRIVRMRRGVRTEGASGTITDSYLGNVSSGIAIFGGQPDSLPTVVCERNRVDYHVNGIAIVGAEGAGTAIRGVIRDNDIVTSFTGTGPTNPAALRINPVETMAVPGPDGTVRGHIDATVTGNRIRGSALYGIAVHAGMPGRAAGVRYTGTISARFDGNTIDPTVEHPSLITFSNARATVFPCEIDPAHTRATCPQLGNPPTYWDYLEHATYSLWHGGELDGALIDHPGTDPITGRVLGNILMVNDGVVGYQTFVVIPPVQ